MALFKHKPWEKGREDSKQKGGPTISCLKAEMKETKAWRKEAITHADGGLRMTGSTCDFKALRYDFTTCLNIESSLFLRGIYVNECQLRTRK